MYEKIVVGTDGLGPASKAVQRAAHLASAHGGELLALHVRSSKHAGGAPLRDPGAAPGVDAAAGLLKDITKRYGDEVRVRTFMRAGDPAEELVRLAREEDADVVVVGNVGMTDSKRFFVGNIPNTVSHHAPCHVLIAHTSSDEAPRVIERYAKVLVGVDGSPTAQRAFDHALTIAEKEDAEVIVVSVHDPGKSESETQKILNEAEEVARSRGVRASGRLERGEPSDAIVQCARNEGADLIVIGNRGMSGVGRFISGSVPNRVSHHMSCDLLIARTT